MKIKNKWLYVALVFLVIFVSWYALKKKEENRREAIVEVNARQIFVNACVNDTVTESMCTCMYNFIRSEYSINEFADLKGRALNKISWDAAVACYKE